MKNKINPVLLFKITPNIFIRSVKYIGVNYRIKSLHMEITVTTNINLPVKKVWELWTDPKHIVRWNFATSTWHTPRAENDLKAGGKFNYRMEAKDGSVGFDFSGSHTGILLHKYILTRLDDGRSMKVFFTEEDNITKISEIFEAESTNPPEMQKQGWQSILDNFRNYAENVAS